MKEKLFQNKLSLGLGMVLVASFIIAYSFFSGWLGFNSHEPVAKKLAEQKPQIKADTKIKKVIVFKCEDKVITTIPTTTNFIGMDYEGFQKEFSLEDGWQIDDSVPNELIITRQEDKICPFHREFRHLGIDDGYLAIYEGPLGYNHKVLQRENVAVSSLPEEVQDNLNLAMNYNQQSADIQARLKGQLEFEEESRLATVLENFDEYREE